MSDSNIIIPKFPKDENPDKWSPDKDWEMRNRYWDVKSDDAIRRVRRGHSRSRWTFGMPPVSQERWDQIFKKEK